MRSEEIRKDELREAGDTPRDLSKNVQDCAYFLREIAAQLAERNERERGQGADAIRTPSPTEAPPEDRTVPAHGRIESATIVQPQAGDVIAQVANIIRTKFHENPATSYNEIATEVLQVIVRTLLAESEAIASSGGINFSDQHSFVKAVIREASRNLGLEV